MSILGQELCWLEALRSPVRQRRKLIQASTIKKAKEK